MRIITISREFGSGGRELGKRLSDIMGFDYYDSEIIAAVARNSGSDCKYVEKILNNHGWQNFPVTFRSTFGTLPYLQANKVTLLLEQKKVIEGIAALGKDCIIVGRSADILLEQYHPFNIFVCARMDAKIRRCMERAGQDENLSKKELLSKIRQVDRVRSQTREILTSSTWGQRDAYHLIINTSDWQIKDLALAVADFAARWFGG